MCELAAVKRRIEAALFHQLDVGSLLDYVALPHDKYNIRAHYGRKAVSYHKARFALHKLFKGALYTYFGLGVY